MAQINSLEKAITHRDEREPDEKFTLHLTAEQMKKLVRDAPDDVADLALDALADAH